MKNVELFVKSKIAVGDYQLLPKEIADGPIYKINNYGDLKKDGYECGFLYLPAGTSIKEHMHTDDIEQYRLVSGQLSVHGNNQCKNECHIGQYHNIDPVPVDTIISTCKISKKFFTTLDLPIDSRVFQFFEQEFNVVSNDEKIINKSK